MDLEQADLAMPLRKINKMVDINEYKKTGYQLVKGLFSADEIDKVRLDAQHIFTNQIQKFGYKLGNTESDLNNALIQLFNEKPEVFIACGKHIQHLISLHNLSLNSRIIELLKALGISFPNICTRPVMFFNAQKLAKKQVYWKTDPHQDWRSMQGSLNSIVVWVALCDIDISLGALEIIPNSHLKGLQAKEMVDSFGLINDEQLANQQFVPIEVKKGDALFFSSFLIHQSGNNSTENGIRWSCHFRYNDMDEKEFVDRAFPHPYVYYPNPELITPDYPNTETLKNYFK